ncbi:MAG: magnesium transporter [Armatimonadetes bacterium]|jgi:magnesium transporter|nr:magnesium transporter [Armatimonadota bacterium]
MTFALPTTAALEVRDLLERDGPRAVALQLLTLHPVEIAEALEPLDHDERLDVFRALPINIAAPVLLNADAEFRAGLLARLSPEYVAQILDRLPIEHATGILEQLDDDKQADVLAETSPEDAAQIEAIRQCPPSSVGRLMVRRVPRIRSEWTVAEAFRYVRRRTTELETINNLYVLAEDGTLRGVVSLRELVEADPQAPIRELMQTRLVMVTPDTDREEAANLISRYNFLALPVVDERKRLLGIVTVDDLVDVLIQEGTEDVLHMGAVSGGGEADQDSSYWAGRITSAVKKRIGWLLLLFVASSITSQVLQHFHTELQSLVTLSFFIPLLIGTGGNAGSQTVMTVVRGLALGEIRSRDASRVLVRETLTGLLLGLCLGGIAVLGGWALTGKLALGVVLGTSVVAVCAWSTCVGALIPITARLLKIDPTVASAPFISTFVDATGLLIYLLIAKAILGI